MAPGEALLRLAFTASVRSTSATPEAAPGRTSYALPADEVFRALRGVARWLGATVHAVNEDAHWMVLLNPLHDPFCPQEHLTVSVVPTSHETLVDVRPAGVEGRAFTTCARTLIGETSRVLGKGA